MFLVLDWFCSRHSKSCFHHADAEPLAGIFTAHVSKNKLSPCIHLTCRFMKSMFLIKKKKKSIDIIWNVRGCIGSSGMNWWGPVYLWLLLWSLICQPSCKKLSNYENAASDCAIILSTSPAKRVKQSTGAGALHILLHAHANLHKRVVDERPGSRSLQHVVQVVLEPPVTHVSPATLRAVDERFPEQAEPGSLLPLETLGAYSTCCGRGWQQAVSRVVQHPRAGLHIL